MILSSSAVSWAKLTLSYVSSAVADLDSSMIVSVALFSVFLAYAAAELLKVIAEVMVYTLLSSRSK